MCFMNDFMSVVSWLQFSAPQWPLVGITRIKIIQNIPFVVGKSV